MKRLALAAGLALAFHAVLFFGGWDPLERGKAFDLRPRQITLSLTKLPPVPKTPPAPLEKKAPVIEKVPPKQENPKKPPQQKKQVVRPQKPDKKVPKKPKPAMKPDPTPTPPVPRVQEPSAPVELASAKSVMENPPPVSQDMEEETPTPETSESPERQAPAAMLTSALPLYKRNPAPKYPRAARRRGYEGKVILDVLVNRDGKVEALTVSQSSGHAILDKAALEAVATWLFSPALRGEERVAMWIKVPIRFDLQ
jgi:protein TonB